MNFLSAYVLVGRLDVEAVAAWLGPCEPELAVRLWRSPVGEPRWLGSYGSIGGPPGWFGAI
jgi:hypothetical protein